MLTLIVAFQITMQRETRNYIAVAVVTVDISSNRKS